MKILFRLFFGIFILGVLAIASIWGLIMYISMDLPQISSLSDYNPPSASVIYSSDGKVLMELYKEKREIVSMDQIPRRVIDAFLSAEDDKFYEHSGVDYMGVFRAFVNNLLAGKFVQGGSTITQQVAKSLLLSNEKTITRKIKDFLLAQKIEKKLKKDEILFLYLNQVYFGGGYHGVKTAFKGYFNKELKDATIAESALIAGLLVAPGKYSPYLNPQSAKMRQNYVLKRMYETKKISKEEYEKSLNEKLRLYLKDNQPKVGEYFTEWVRFRLMNKFTSEKILTDGFKIVTTINYDLQKIAEEELKKGIRELDKRQGYLGAIKNLPSDDQIRKFEAESLKQLTFKKSSFLDLHPDGKTFYEMQDQVIGEQKLIKNFKTGELFEAVVKKVDDEGRLIFVSIGGFPGMISFENFKWAHERYTDEVPKYFNPVTKPSSIVEKGDVVLVGIINSQAIAFDTLDIESKKKIRDQTVLENLKKQKQLILSLEQEPIAQGSLLSMEPNTGKIITMVGGTNFEKNKFNHAIQAERQPGSCFKPIIYAAGLENGYNPASLLIDSPQALTGADDVLAWKPKNYDGEFKGPITFRQSLEESRNVTTIKLADDVGINKLQDISKRFGITTKMPSDLSISLGSFGITLLDLVQTYSVFPNGGKKIHYKSIESIKDKNGNSYAIDENVQLNKEDSSYENKDETNKNPFLSNIGGLQVYDPRLSYVMLNVMKGVITSGTAAAARSLSSNIAGKTGTTNNYVDAWFTGFSQNLVAGVWVGFDNNRPIGYGETGGKAALPIWIGYMKSAIKKYGDPPFTVPEGIITTPINKKTGKPSKAGDPLTIFESFVQGTEPGSLNPIQLQNEPINPSKVILDDDFYNQ